MIELALLFHSRNLSNERFDDEAVHQAYLRAIEPELRSKRFPLPVISVDTSDLRKQWAKSMPYLATIHDGSRNELGEGYDLISIEAIGSNGRRAPLSLRLVSTKHPDFESLQKHILEEIDRVLPFVPPGAIWVFDRGFDSRRFIAALDQRGLNWAIRLNTRGTRQRSLRAGDVGGKAGAFAEGLCGAVLSAPEAIQVWEVGSERRVDRRSRDPRKLPRSIAGHVEGELLRREGGVAAPGVAAVGARRRTG